MALAKERPIVYLPSHDTESATRLAEQSVLPVNAAHKLSAVAD
jgi:hypothetical protein